MRELVVPVLVASCVVGCETTPDPLPPAPGEPRRYVAYRAAQEPVIDGRLDDPAWVAAEWSDAFVDIEGDVRPRPTWETRMMIAWDTDALYVAARLEEPHVWATLREHDEIVYHDNDFEVFIDPDSDSRQYYEIEINALETIFDLFLERTYRAGGPADHDWDVAGLRKAVHVNGTLNDPSDIDASWSVELAIPWPAFGDTAHRPMPPEDGDLWRMNFSRVQWQVRIVEEGYEKVPDTPENNWVWSPQGVIDMHLPGRWGEVVFREREGARETRGGR
jgi:hypothetical protein